MRELQKDDDFRYVMVLKLVREGRPKYWTFHCPYCKAVVGELSGNIVYASDISNEASNSFRTRCAGSTDKFQGHCRMWFEIQLIN